MVVGVFHHMWGEVANNAPEDAAVVSSHGDGTAAAAAAAASTDDGGMNLEVARAQG